ncbi:MAG: hypothetical protein R3287_13420 [Anderseniella sp.]|nr:hypothetical protein [Anderseniella sp.]
MTALSDARILLALNAGDAADEAIALAARLASSLHTHIHGLMVEDQALLDAAALPVTSIVARRGVTPPEFSLAAVERSLNQAEQDVRTAFSAVARRLNLSWTVQRLRGGLADSLSACMAANDIVVLPVDRPGAGFPNTVSDLRKISGQVQGIVLPPRKRTFRRGLSGPVVAIDAEDQTGKGVVALASRLAAGMDCPLHVLKLADPALANEDVLAARVSAVAPGLLVASMHARLFSNEPVIARLQNAARAPLLLLCGPEFQHALPAREGLQDS